MTIPSITPFTGPAPTRDDPATFSARGDTLMTELVAFPDEMNAAIAAINSIGALGGVLAIAYTFSTTTTDLDPTDGYLRLNNATQNASTVIRVDLLDTQGSDWSTVIDAFDESSSTIKGQIKLVDLNDGTKFLTFNVTAVGAESGYRNITVVNTGGSAASPFASGASVMLVFARTGDKGETGATGATGAAGTNGTNGVGMPALVTPSSVSVSLTSTPTLVVMTPATHGTAVTLHDATASSPQEGFHTVDNQSGYTVAIKNFGGTVLGYLQAYQKAICSLTAASSNGTWSITNIEPVGAVAQIVTTLMTTIYIVIDLGSGYEMLVGTNGSNIYAVVRDNLGATSGSVTLIRSGVGNHYSAISCGSNKVLVVSCNSTTAWESVVLSVTGTSIAVGTAETKTLSANITNTANAFAHGGLQAVGSAYVVSYHVDTNFTCQSRAVTVSGTTPSTGNAVTFGSIDNARSLVNTVLGSTFVTCAASHAGVGGTGYWYAQPYTVSGNTLTPGTGVTYTTSSANQASVDRLIKLDETYIYLATTVANQTIFQDNILKLAGTTLTASSSTTRTGLVSDLFKISSTKVYTCTNSNVTGSHLVTHSAGTISVSGAVAIGSNAAPSAIYANGNTLYMSVSNAASLCAVDCSGASPVAGPLLPWPSTSAIAKPDGGVSSQSHQSVLGQRSANTLTKSTAAYSINTGSSIVARTNLENGSQVIRYVAQYAPYTTNFRGKNDREAWVYSSAGYLTKVECIA